MNRLIYATSIYFVLFCILSLTFSLQVQATTPEKPKAPFVNPPVIEANAADTADITVACIADIPIAIDLNATDDNDPTFPKMISPVDNPAIATINPCTGGVITRRWIAVDVDNMTDTVTQIITVLPDTKPPVPLIPEIKDTVDCSVRNYTAWLNSTRLSIATNISECNFGPGGITDNAPATFTKSCGAVNVLFTITDICGNDTFWNASYTVIDDEKPQLIGLPTKLNDTISCTAPIPLAPTVTATDNCTPNLTVTFTQNSGQTMDGSCSQYNYTIVRNWVVSDSCGNVTNETQRILVQDKAPTFITPIDLTITCADNATDLTLTGVVTNLVDSCGGTPTLTFSDSRVDSVCAYEYTIERSWKATDVCGNTSTRIQRIDVVDDQLPTFTIPRDTTVTCEQTPSTTVTGVPTSVDDNCDLAPKVEYEDVIQAGTCANTYTVKRTWRVIDACGNINSGMQFINVKDTLAPVFATQAQNLKLVCANNVDVVTAYNNWISTRGGATATDNCTETANLTWTLLESGTSNPATLPSVICPAPDSIIRFITVDFMVADECGNRDTTTASFSVIDDNAPELRNCPRDTTIAAALGECEVVFTLRPPIIQEECATSINTEDITVVKTITSNAAPGEEAEILVNPLELEFDLAANLPVNVLGNGTFTIILRQVDAEAPDEYFNIFAEDGSSLGRTVNSAQQCDTSKTVLTINSTLLTNWAVDGVIKFQLKPNIPAGPDSSLAINALCSPAGTATGRLQLQTKNFTGLSYAYRVNGATPVVVNPITSVDVTLPTGDNEITYYATDCVGLVDSCVYTVTITDREAPELFCPDDIAVQLDSGKCVAAIKLPLPTGATDNCGIDGVYENTQPSNVSDALLTFNLNPTLNKYQANEKTFTFTNVAANAVNDATLTLDLLGDFNTNNAYFRIIGDDGIALDSTAVGIATCTTPGQKIVTIPMAKFNTWASDGTIQIKVQPRTITVPPGVAGDGINPCDTAKVSFNGDTDSTSFVLATLTYDRLTPSYYATGATPLPLTPMTPPVVTPMVNFNVGETQVFYVLKDVSGNADTCSYKVTVEDKERPVARCQPTTIFINPSGLDVETISAMVINAGSSDNCSIDTMFLTPNTFNCAQAETNATVTLTVRDLAGNTATCQSLVRIEAEEPLPTATSGLCGGDTLFLSANPPAATGGIIYTYKWTGPNGFSSTERNPIVRNIGTQNAGTYSVEVSGITGCKSIGTVQVAIEDLPLTPAVVSKANVCVNENIVLNSSVVPSGSSVTYRWYRGAAPNGTLIGTTSVPSFTIPQPHSPGTNGYYITIEADGCLSSPSASFSVTANSMPTAAVNDAEITICEGESVTLGTLVSGPGITYEWSGPNNYASTNQFPAVINPIGTANAGVYRLVVLRNGCPSMPAFTVVNVKPKPKPNPQVVNTGAACEGTNVTLSTTTTGASVYHWIAPNLQEFLTTTNQYVISNITEAQEGPWRLYVTQNGCNSDFSNATSVIVNTVPATVASVNPMEPCEGNTFQLFASPSLTNATYSWTGPNGFVAATQNPSISNATQAREGTYQVRITTQEGCSKTATVPVDVRRGVSVTGVSNNGQNCLSGPTDIRLRGTVFPVNDGSYRYSWTGPNFSSSDSVAIIPNATQANNGNYQLVVTNNDGCASQPMTTVVKVSLPPATPNAPSVSPTTPAPYCEGKAISIVVNAYNGSTISYNWKTPKGLVITPTPALTLPNPTRADSGLYSVSVVIDGCVSQESGAIALNINPAPRIFATSNSPVCTGDQIQLNATVFSGATYSWTGPSGFSSALANPPIPNANATVNNGFYKVSAVVNGCSSNIDSVPVLVNLRPNILPTPTNTGPICIGNANAALRLSVAPNPVVQNAIYTWYDQAGKVVGETTSLNLDITNFSDYGNGNYLFTVTSKLNGCSSAQSNPTVVVMNTIPNEQAFAGQDIKVCEADSIKLSGRQPLSGSGIWTLAKGDTTGVRIVTPALAASALRGLKGDSTYTFRWTLSNGACTNYAFDEVVYNLIPIEIPNAGNDTLVCAIDTIRLDALLPISGEGRWTQSDAQQTLGVRILEPLNPQTVIRGLQAGNLYEFTWTIVSGCGGLFDKVAVLTSDTDPNAGDDAIVCNEDQTAVLNAVTPAAMISLGTWSSPNPKISFTDLDDPKATAFNLEIGRNTFIWTIDDALCGNAGRDTVVFTYKQNPLAIRDIVAAAFNAKTEFNVLANDTVPAGTTVRIVTQPGNGSIESLNSGSYSYLPKGNFVGTDELTYEICSQGCECSSEKVIFQVGENVACNIPSIITPNGDGINDFFVVPCFIVDTNYPSNQVSIFNQWGDEVYHSSIPYRNNWDGKFNGEDLPPGTYFYIINFGDSAEAKSGFVMIQR